MRYPYSSDDQHFAEAEGTTAALTVHPAQCPRGLHLGLRPHSAAWNLPSHAELAVCGTHLVCLSFPRDDRPGLPVSVGFGSKNRSGPCYPILVILVVSRSSIIALLFKVINSNFGEGGTERGREGGREEERRDRISLIKSKNDSVHAAF